VWQGARVLASVDVAQYRGALEAWGVFGTPEACFHMTACLLACSLCPGSARSPCADCGSECALQHPSESDIQSDINLMSGGAVAPIVRQGSAGAGTCVLARLLGGACHASGHTSPEGMSAASWGGVDRSSLHMLRLQCHAKVAVSQQWERAALVEGRLYHAYVNQPSACLVRKCQYVLVFKLYSDLCWLILCGPPVRQLSALVVVEQLEDMHVACERAVIVRMVGVPSLALCDIAGGHVGELQQQRPPLVLLAFHLTCG
jgi:hypothetical protein